MKGRRDAAEFAVLEHRARAEARDDASGECGRLLRLAREDTPAAREALAAVLAQRGRPLWALETASFSLGCAGDRRAFETLVFLLNHRDPVRGATAAHALARLSDPRTARAAAVLATNELRTAYALHPVRLLTALSAPEAVPTLVELLARLLDRPGAPHPVVLACVEGLGRLGDARARPVLREAAGHHRLRAAAEAALARTGA
ncbi:HEAT repeat domain-containing protein [Streptomyces sp. TR06-5]|uniref:HEAT repeat domain-containing protein n=1 Tax=unclassified Streptomyces TaxID=2593676 RepID=UPI0039A28607